jgi:L-aspartate oxidase
MREEQSGSRSGQAPPIEIPCRTEEQVRALAWDHCGIVRSGAGLEEAWRALSADPVRLIHDPDLSMYELRNIHAVAGLIARCALAREESRGAHYRLDFPVARPEFQRHSCIARGNEVFFQ